MAVNHEFLYGLHGRDLAPVKAPAGAEITAPGAASLDATSQAASVGLTSVSCVTEVMGAAEIAVRLGVSRQRVQQLVRRPDWPEPLAELTMGKVWRTSDIEAWIREHRPAPDAE